MGSTHHWSPDLDVGRRFSSAVHGAFNNSYDTSSEDIAGADLHFSSIKQKQMPNAIAVLEFHGTTL